MTDKELISQLQALQAEMYVQKIPLAAHIVQNFTKRFIELKAENEKLQSVKWAVDAIEKANKERQGK